MPDLEQQEFEQLLRRIRMGDEGAALQLVRLYESELRREVRLRLTDFRLRRTLDSMDICQSVFGYFFAKTVMGQLEFDRPEQILNLLSRMARNKVIDWHRRERSRRPRNGNRIEDIDTTSGVELHDRGDSPSEVVKGQELLELIQSKLTNEEEGIAALRRGGRSWSEISAITGKSPEALRKRLARACDRVFEELGLEN